MISTLLISFGLVAQSPVPTGPVRLSLQDAIRTSLEKNLQVQVAVETRNFSQANVQISQGAFDWTLNGAASYGHSKSTFDNKVFQIGTPAVSGSNTSDSRNLSLGVLKPFEWGGTFSMNYNPTYQSNATNRTGFPSSVTLTPYTGILSASYTQSLLKGFGRQVAEANVIVAKKGAIAADYQFQKSIIDLVASTETLYWGVVSAQRNLENKQQALTLAQKQLKENRIRVEVGTLAPIEVTSAEAAEAQRQQDIIKAEADFANAKDALLRSLYPSTTRPESLELTDSPTLSHITTDEKSAEKMALERRVELKTARLDLESKQILEGVSRNRLKPQLDLKLAYNGNAADYDTFSPVNSDLWQAKNPGYNVGLTFSMPLPNRAAKGSMAQARANLRSSELTLRDLELGIALEVRTALRDVDSMEKGVKAAEKTRIFRAKDLEAEQKKYENGMSTNFLVLSKQDVLDSAKSAELQSQISYAKAVTTL
ncbi:MAG: TolC family protein, partial [Holophaga sp.]|nr:TolC family protein [Holophaga sp.]